MRNLRHSAGLYFAAQGLAVLGWWILLIAVPASRAYFQMGDSEAILLAFWLPDLVLLALGSLLVSACIRLDSKLLTIVLWLVVGTISYATLYCLAFAMMTDTGWLGVVMMLAAMIISGNFAIGLSPVLYEKMFRNSVGCNTGWILAKTSIQIVVVWGLILLVFPMLIVLIEEKIGIPRFTFPWQKVTAALLFVSNSFVGIACALTMAKSGQGTPLPMDSASKLVTGGTYAFVRNPMAISGVGQGLSVGLFLGSPLVLLYALLGAAIWQVIIRPLEELDLLARFGTDYQSYRHRVRCWIPRARPLILNSKLDHE